MDAKVSLHQRIRNVFTKAFYKMLGITIGKGSYVHHKAYIDFRRGKTIIGTNVFIDYGCIILTHARFVPHRDDTKPTIIEDGVFLLKNATIFPEITVGRNSIVYPGSVVMKNIPENSIVMGNPAKITGSVDDKD